MALNLSSRGLAHQAGMALRSKSVSARPSSQLHGISRKHLSHGGSSERGGKAETKALERRMVLSMLGGAIAAPQLVQGAWAEEVASSDANSLTAITGKVYLELGIAPTAFKADRTIGDKNVMPVDTAENVGRIVIGLYGNAAPTTVANFLALIRSGALVNTAVSRVLPGEYIMAGQQGSKRLGQVQSPIEGVVANKDTTSSSAFRLTHSRPGTVSLAMSENDEDPRLKEDPEYRNFEFLITTGPGPVPRLDGTNIVFGRVLEGLGTISTVTTVPTFKPMERTAAMNMFAKAIGDDRAVAVRRKYGKPLKAVLILGAGELPA